MKNAAQAVSQSSVSRILDAGMREATLLEQDMVRVVIDDEGGMIPELSAALGHGRINAHWLPWFRALSKERFNKAEHGAFWGDRVTYNLAGNFPTFPNFASAHVVDGIDMPAHGWSANSTWCFVNKGIDEASGAAWALSVMESPNDRMALSFKKIDMVIPGHPVHYASLTVKNNGSKDITINAGFHNTLGAPFLQAGCRYSAAADRWSTPPVGGGFDESARLIQGKEFSSPEQAPLAKGGTVDISLIPPPIGYTDFVQGSIPVKNVLGWSALVNPVAKMAYVCFFPGPAGAVEDDIVLRFNCLWMQYGGRPMTPWAAFNGGTDLTYCLGTENVIAASTGGLSYSRQVSSLLGAPTTVIIPAGGQKTLRYGTLFTPYDSQVLDTGIQAVSAEDARIIAAGRSGTSCSFTADPGFVVLRTIEKMVTVHDYFVFSVDVF
jgi:hypothetical protein